MSAPSLDGKMLNAKCCNFIKILTREGTRLVSLDCNKLN